MTIPPPVTPSKLKILTQVTTSLIIPIIPISYWYYTAQSDRQKHQTSIRTKVRVPNVQTIDDLMIEKCQPGDVILFDRRCYKCASSPLAAFSCLLSKAFLCDNGSNSSDKSSRKIVDGTFDHVGIVVPGYQYHNKTNSSNLLLLEATSGEGVVARPLLQRLEMSQSRTVLLLQLASPGERRNDDNYEPTVKTIQLHNHFCKQLCKFRDSWVKESERQNYNHAHSMIGIFGSLGYVLGLHKTSKLPISPASFLVVSALMESGAGLNTNLSERVKFESRPENFLRDYRFYGGGNHDENDVIRLRPGWRFLTPVILRETSKS